MDYICESLDSKGYYSELQGTLSERLGIKLEEELYYVQIIQSLEPAGVGAHSLIECLLLQLERLEKEQFWDLKVEKEIVGKYMEILAKNQIHVIAKKMGIAIEDINQAVNRIKQLNPIPSRGFNGRDLCGVLEPDVTIIKWKDYFQILLNEYQLPQFRISSYYKGLLDCSAEREVKIYLNGKIKQVEKLQEAILRRNTTLLELTKYILEKQETFFIYGHRGYKALQMQEAAKALCVHESTISRTIKNKYLQCCWGIYPLHYFFSRGGVLDSKHEDVLQEDVKGMIKKLVDDEDIKHPYSDNRLTELLNEKGICISRRTVTKYREEMGIGSSRERKLFN